MKVIDTPRTNRIGNQVAYVSPFGQCFRKYCVPRSPDTPPQTRARADFGDASRDWGARLTELQRERWAVAAQTVPSHPSLGQYGHLSGQQLSVKINSTLRCVGQAPVDEPSDPVLFGPNPVGEFVIDYDAQGQVRLLLGVSAVSEDIMVFGQAPCSAGRMKHRRVGYLGLLGPATNGQCDVAALYTARFGQPTPGQKVFLVTNQHKNGWKGPESVFCAIVPPRPLPGEAPIPAETQAAAAAPAATPEAPQAPAKADSSLCRVMYKRSTPDAQAQHSGLKREHAESTPWAPLVHTVPAALARLRTLGMRWVRA